MEWLYTIVPHAKGMEVVQTDRGPSLEWVAPRVGKVTSQAQNGRDVRAGRLFADRRERRATRHRLAVPSCCTCALAMLA